MIIILAIAFLSNPQIYYADSLNSPVQIKITQFSDMHYEIVYPRGDYATSFSLDDCSSEGIVLCYVAPFFSFSAPPPDVPEGHQWAIQRIELLSEQSYEVEYEFSVIEKFQSFCGDELSPSSIIERRSSENNTVVRFNYSYGCGLRGWSSTHGDGQGSALAISRPGLFAYPN
jgi:hypothetical protein